MGSVTGVSIHATIKRNSLYRQMVYKRYQKKQTPSLANSPVKMNPPRTLLLGPVT